MQEKSVFEALRETDKTLMGTIEQVQKGCLDHRSADLARIRKLEWNQFLLWLIWLVTVVIISSVAVARM